MWIKIIKGVYGSNLITDSVFESVDGKLYHGRNGYYLKLINSFYDNLPKKILKISVGKKDYEIMPGKTKPPILRSNQAKLIETDEEISNRIEDGFNTMDQLIMGCADRKLKGLVVSGAPGLGKSYNVQKVLDTAGFENIIINREDDEDFADEEGGIDLKDDEDVEKKYYVMIKGRITPLGLYKTLFQNKDTIIVFDDCDHVLYERTSLNLLKAALDSYERRILCWNSSAVGITIPKRFEFTGTIIFISNIHFDMIKEGSQLRSHIDAIMSRCHFIDLSMKTNREKIIRIKDVVKSSNIFYNYDLEDKEKVEIVDFIEEYQESFREISLRTALKIAEIKAIDPDNWRRIAKMSCMEGKIKEPLVS